MKKKLNILNLILSIVAPIALITVVVISIVFGWYTNRQQVANIDATTKNVAVEYTFDDDTEKNVLNYTVNNLAFFDIDSNDEDNNKIELRYLPVMAVKLSITLKNNSSNDINYKIIFESKKTIKNDSNDDPVSIAYIDCLFYDVKTNLTDNNGDLDIPSTLTTVEDIKGVSEAGITYTNVTNGNGTAQSPFTTTSKAVRDSAGLSTGKILKPTDDAVTVDMYIYGVQEIDSAKNDDFLYETVNNVKTLKKYNFSLTIESVPLGEAQVSEQSSE